MKEFTAKQMHNAPGQVFRAADKDGKTKIDHSHYKDKDFFLIAEDRASIANTGLMGIPRLTEDEKLEIINKHNKLVESMEKDDE